MFTLQINCATIEDAERVIAALKFSASPAIVENLATQIPFNDPSGLSDAESPAAKYFPNTTNTATTEPEPKKRGRPRREVAEQPAAPLAEDHDAKHVPEEPTQQALTLDDARNALKGVQAKYGTDDLAKPLEILGQFSAGRISEVRAEQYPAFIAACKAA